MRKYKTMKLSDNMGVIDIFPNAGKITELKKNLRLI